MLSFIISFSLGLNDSLIVVMGNVNMQLPTDNSIASATARVRGITIVTVIPWPLTLLMATCPPIPSIFCFTTSMPTPLPEYSVTFSVVEKPGSITKENISLSVISLAGFFSKPCSFAFLIIFSLSRPLPSSETEIRTSPPTFCADRVILALGDFPAFILSFSDSTP